MLKCIIAGGRDFKNYHLLKTECNKILKNISVEEIVSGGQVSRDPNTNKGYGADFLGEKYAAEKGFRVRKFLADWNTWGASAGPRRNKEMAEYVGKNGMLIAFWDGKTKGTKSMIFEARSEGMRVHIINY